jgi:hypothetical protein
MIRQGYQIPCNPALTGRVDFSFLLVTVRLAPASQSVECTLR